ncbi:3-hydroxyacyl-CoA dehydrogenase family protein [Actinomadura welshii]|uniref:3-hydroxyacyl-CoA dehydrogenase family protein n=1 Tax=Actinomadura welshii TaxID=3103817 RepID=UPI00228657C7|nr:3-hydroxyacyl-CoA dehydrogenase family protein [Actinomadura madurae]
MNSLPVPLLFAAGRLWVNGVATPETIDAAWRIASLSPFGPFQTLDVIGLTTAYHVTAGAPDPDVQAFAAALGAVHRQGQARHHDGRGLSTPTDSRSSQSKTHEKLISAMPFSSVTSGE